MGGIGISADLFQTQPMHLRENRELRGGVQGLAGQPTGQHKRTDRAKNHMAEIHDGAKVKSNARHIQWQDAANNKPPSPDFGGTKGKIYSMGRGFAFSSGS
jgi:hypothetical protein